MKAFGINQYGSIDRFEELQVAAPELKPHQVLLEVLAVGVNPYDVKVRNGTAAQTRPLTLPVIPGSDVVGKVVKIGDSETLWHLNDILIGRAAMGAYGEFVAVGEKMAVRLPAEMPITQGAALPTVGVTAYDLVHSDLAIQAGQTVAVIGAAGNVGSLVVQLAAAAGANVLGLASSKNHQFLHELGIKNVLDYHDPIPNQFINQVDAVINTVNGGGHLRRAEKLIKPLGRIVTLNEIPQNFQQTTVKIEAFNDASYHQNQKALHTLTEMFEKRQLRIRIGKELPLSLTGVKTSHQLIEDHQIAGKIILLKGNH